MSNSVTVNDITAISHRFVVKWSIPVADLISKSVSDDNITLRSNRYRFKGIKNLEFSYIVFYIGHYVIRVECETDMPMFLDDALVLMKDRVYRFECTPTNTRGKLIFNPKHLSDNSYQDDENVTLHCIMSIPAQVTAVIHEPKPGDHEINVVECESIVTIPDIYPFGYDDVNEFGYSSRIPDFNVSKALRMMGKANKRHKPLLKALCSDYLMENLTAENVAEVLKQSMDSNAHHLVHKCIDFLSEKCKIVSIY